MNIKQLEHRICVLEKLINKYKKTNESVSLSVSECDKLCSDIENILIKNGITDVDVTVDDYDTVYGLDITVNCNRDFVTYSIFFNSEDDIEVMYDIGVNTDSSQKLCRCKSLRECAKNIAKHFSLYYNG